MRIHPAYADRATDITPNWQLYEGPDADQDGTAVLMNGNHAVSFPSTAGMTTAEKKHNAKLIALAPMLRSHAEQAAQRKAAVDKILDLAGTTLAGKIPDDLIDELTELSEDLRELHIDILDTRRI